MLFRSVIGHQAPRQQVHLVPLQPAGKHLNKRVVIRRFMKQPHPPIPAVQNVVESTGDDVANGTSHNFGVYTMSQRKARNSNDPFSELGKVVSGSRALFSVSFFMLVQGGCLVQKPDITRFESGENLSVYSYRDGSILLSQAIPADAQASQALLSIVNQRKHRSSSLSYAPTYILLGKRTTIDVKTDCIVVNTRNRGGSFRQFVVALDPGESEQLIKRVTAGIEKGS